MAEVFRAQTTSAGLDDRSPWKLFDPPRREWTSDVTCICLPYAGGSGSVFAEWGPMLAGRMDVLPAHLPGRGKRFSEAPYVTFDELLDDLVAAALPFTSREFAIFGHSLGGLLAYELAYELHARHMRNAVHLFVSGTGAPHVPEPESAVLKEGDYALDDPAFARKLALLGGLPPEVTPDPELMQIALPTIRADLRVYASYVTSFSRRARRVPCPISAIGGHDDLANVPERALRAWSEYTWSRFSLRLFPGDHFFLHSQRDALIGYLLSATGGRR